MGKCQPSSAGGGIGGSFILELIERDETRAKCFYKLTKTVELILKHIHLLSNSMEQGPF
jgi:hypothetical protein